MKSFSKYNFNFVELLYYVRRADHSAFVVEMNEPSSVAIRGKKDSSITVAMNLAKEKKVDAVVSAGHTGAAVAASVAWRRANT